MLTKVKRFLLRLLAHLPTQLPLGIQEFDTWSRSIIDMYGLPDNDSVRFALAVSICHYQKNSAMVPKRYFGNVLLKGAANQIAGGVMQDLKDKQAAAQAALQPIAEVTPVAQAEVIDVKKEN